MQKMQKSTEILKHNQFLKIFYKMIFVIPILFLDRILPHL